MGVPQLLAHDQIHTVTYNLNFTHFGGAAIASQAALSVWSTREGR